MSRIGKKPIVIPKGIDVKVDGQSLIVKGPKGTLNKTIPDSLKAEIKDNLLSVSAISELTSDVQSLWGLFRILFANMIEGVGNGFKKTLDITGVGYKVELKGADIVVAVGFSHTVTVKAPIGIKFSVENPTRVHVEGIDNELVGRLAAQIRAIKKPEPYKQKGIRYSDEKLRKKAGKTAGK